VAHPEIFSFRKLLQSLPKGTMNVLIPREIALLWWGRGCGSGLAAQTAGLVSAQGPSGEGLPKNPTECTCAWLEARQGFQGISRLNSPAIENPASLAESGFVSGISPAVRTLETVVAEIAPTNIPVLLIGESGTGKEVFARRIHQLSRRCNEPLVKVACAALNAANFAMILGANGSAAGNGAGTIFLDEIGELDPVCQRNLLYALPEGDGAFSAAPWSARIVSTTSEYLEEEIRAGRFRSQLYYRINGVCLRLPPLRERAEDIPLLVEFLLTKHAERLQRPRPSISPRGMRHLLDQSWPGNIRELENVVMKIVALGDEDRAFAESKAPSPPPRVSESLEARGYSLRAASRAASREAERELILKALARTRWNRRRAAQELQISYKSLLYKLKQIGFDDTGTN
jgi:two-component system, NtrC family, response regulator AtoC